MSTLVGPDGRPLNADNAAELVNVEGQPLQEKFGLFIDPDRLRILPKDMWDTGCTNCNKAQSKWAMVTVEEPDKPFIICSMCFLYDSGWGEKRRAELDVVITEIEAQNTIRIREGAIKSSTKLTAEQIEAVKVEFPRDETGKMINPKHADDVMGKLLLISHVYREEMKKLQGDVAKHQAAQAIMPGGFQFVRKEPA